MHIIMKGFISVTLMAVIAVSTLVFSGAGFGIYKYQEVKKENAQIKADLDEQKDIEIALLREQIQSDSLNSSSTVTNSTSTNSTSTQEQLDTITAINTPVEQPLPRSITPALPSVTEPVVETVVAPTPTPAPVVQTDIYGMTMSEWSSLESQIPSLEKRISQIKNIKSDLEDSLDSIKDMERSFLDWIPLLTSGGQKLAQDGLEIAGESRALTYQEINYAQSIISGMSKIIDAIDNRNGNAYESNLTYTESQQDKWNSITSESKAKYTLLLSTYSNFSYYITGE